jgi:hypothetical protein
MALTRQPKNNLAQWGVTTDDGEYVGVENGGLIATSAIVGTLRFSDGSKMTTAGSGLPSAIDSGTY